MSLERGQIYFVNLNPVKGREQAGERPVLILSIDAINRLPLVVTVVVVTKGANLQRNYPTNVRVAPDESGLLMETVFMGFQVRSLDATRFLGNPVGKLVSNKMQDQSVEVVLYDREYGRRFRWSDFGECDRSPESGAYACALAAILRGVRSRKIEATPIGEPSAKTNH